MRFVGGALYGFLILRFVYHDHLKQIWKWKSVTWENMKPILLRWVIACAGMLVFIWFYDPERMFRLALERPQFIPFLMIAYPVLSALPQEFIFCSFFFERYKPFFWQRHAHGSRQHDRFCLCPYFVY
ncbi:MAG: hypothetical protein LRZ85_00480 [Alphaproteobacteria bacterium]|nr:hypothetical protein [Alphaproteobacteria bacterium]